MSQNHTMMQFFEWHILPDGTHWKRLKELASELKNKGIDSVWIPPPTKAQTPEDTGYGIYDLYDLGEFDQNGSVRTKYGTKDELVEAIEACRENDICVYADVVMNHKAGADETERFKVIEVDQNNRTKEISGPFDIDGWTKFTFPGRGDTYSSFKWNVEHFNGTDYDEGTIRTGIFKILGEHKGWNDNVDREFGNYDYLMFANIDYNHPAVREEMIKWGKWLTDTLRCDGYRLDAVKHIDYTFIRDFATEMRGTHGDHFYMFAEYWNPDLKACQEYLQNVEFTVDLIDVPLHFKLFSASQAGRDFDLRTIFDDTLVQANPLNAVTFVDNHDSQPGESLESWIQDWFKQSAYALILLRHDGYPCVFYGDYYGVGGEEPVGRKSKLIDPLLYARVHKAYGEQIDYFDHPNTIGWVRMGTSEHEGSGCAVVISNGDNGEKRMFVGEERAGESWVDCTENRSDTVEIGDDGWAVFPVNGGSVSVWVMPDSE